MNNKVEKFDHHYIEAKWRNIWTSVNLYEADIINEPEPFYNLMMFPYPSAEGLHVGNMYAFTGSDIFGRYKRMQGYNVFEPIGLDGFGIHSENYALKIGRHPMDHAKITQKNFYNQLYKIGSMYDWTRTLETYDPDYYKWTQWLFVQMFKYGLAYRKKASVNFCPSCKTVLADEQVIDGKCERCGNIVEKRLLEQWFFKITAYAEKLQINISALNWSEIVKTAQINWIGKKEGINITYQVVDRHDSPIGEIKCFTTRPDTNYGATFVVIAPEHPFITHIFEVTDSKERDLMQAYIKKSLIKPENERIAEGKKKTGIFTGLYCINNLNNYKMPLYISDFVIMGYGTGAVVGVPGHDRRDYEFAQVFHLPVIRVVKIDSKNGPITQIDDVREDEGIMINSGFLNGLDIHQATLKIMDYLENKGWGERVTSYHLRDWLISRQRYWGPPIPMIFCGACAKAGRSWFTTSEAIKYQSESKSDRKSVDQKNNLKDQMPGWYPVSEDELPVKLPRIEDYKPGDDGIAPLAKHKEFYETKCPGCGGLAVRETDVSDTFLDSSWYFLRYPSICHKNIMAEELTGSEDSNIAQNSRPTLPEGISNTAPWNPQITKKWLPVDMYTGGAEHSVLHLLYSRFVTMALYDWGYLDFEEPFKKFFAHGLVIRNGTKMSKSKGNVVNPDDYINLYGSDAFRLYLMFMGPFSAGGDFQDASMEGVSRWVGRVWRLALNSLDSQISAQPVNQQSQNQRAKVNSALQYVIKKVTEDLEARRYNTAIASMMEFTNLVANNGNILTKSELSKFILLLAPLAPFLTEEIWQMIRGNNEKVFKPGESVHTQKWPEYDPSVLVSDSVKVVIQVNGKVRDIFSIPSTDAQDRHKLEEAARSSEKVSKYINGQTIRKVVVVPGKLVNLVI